MKLNYKRTLLVGLAFLSISAFWQMYDSIVPLLLKNTFNMDESLAGVIMSADNVLALFLLPLFGGLSDKINTKIGRRTPFILAGTAIAVILMNILPVLDNSYAAEAAPFKFISFVIVLGILLIAMGIYRSPAVALMPDVTPKPLRSKGNAIINLMGAVGGVLYLAVAAVMYPTAKVKELAHVDYQPLFIVVSAIMLVAIVVMFLTIREPKLADANRKLEAEHPEWNLAEDDGSGTEKLPVPVKRSLGFLLASIALWYAGYNGVTTWFTTYIDEVMGEGLGGASTCLLVGTVGAIASYLPIGLLASKFGRKKLIHFGVLLLTGCFIAGFALTTLFDYIHPIMYLVFVLVGVAWASINVNSLPMVVEMCRGSDVGKFTGFYYTASMSAQVITPILAGTLLKHVGYHTLFPYAAFFAGLSFITMIFVKHGDSKAEAKRGLDAFEAMDD